RRGRAHARFPRRGDPLQQAQVPQRRFPRRRWRVSIVAADAAGIARAAGILQSGGLVAFPTETVYGLGADATNGKAVARIFEAKGRPSFNPLIVHIADAEAARDFAEAPAHFAALAAAFWPGPLTLVMRRKASSAVSDLVSAGGATIALR